MINYIDLFAGAGGLSEGFTQMGFHPVSHIEMNADACYTLKTRAAYFYLKSHNKESVYKQYIKGEITREDFYESEEWYDEACEEIESQISELEDEITELENQALPEIASWYVVTDFLAKKLIEHGECVIKNEYASDYWGRCCGGQMCYMDGVFAHICEELEILDGQRYTWADKK